MQEQPNSYNQAPPTTAPSFGAPIPAPTGHMGGLVNTGVNDSGTGATAVLPEELKGWSWSAFLMTWIWGIAHNTWLALLCFVPVVNIAMPFVLGFKGNEWAWQNRKWESIQQFKDTQRVWTIWGIVLVVVFIILYVLLFGALAALVALNPSAATPRP